MNETCDRCPARAAYRVTSPHGAELYFCVADASRNFTVLNTRGWVYWPLGVRSLAPQESAA